jgi:hypothetical protein
MGSSALAWRPHGGRVEVGVQAGGRGWTDLGQAEGVGAEQASQQGLWWSSERCEGSIETLE